MIPIGTKLKPGDLVRCIDQGDKDYIKNGHLYPVLRESTVTGPGDMVYIQSLHKACHDYLVSRFELVLSKESTIQTDFL